MKQRAIEKERKKLETEKKSIFSADYDFSEETRDTALRCVYIYMCKFIYTYIYICIYIYV
jgi:hypothetical protein